MKKFISVILMVIMIAGLFQNSIPVMADTHIDSYGSWEYTDNGSTITITKYNGSAAIVEIPSEINSKPVTSIKDEALAGSTSLTSITILNNTILIGEWVFSGCKHIVNENIIKSIYMHIL